MSVLKPFFYLYNYYLNPGYVRKKYIYPTHVNFPITDNCNSKCQMCNVWKDKSVNELTPEEIRKIFKDRLFIKTKHLGISGGEPTLRKDLIECIKAILDSIEGLRSLSITTHGFHPTKWERFIPIIKTLCVENQVNFSINVSVDGIGELHEEVRRIENGWDKVLNTIRIIKDYGITLQVQSTISKHNIFGVNEILYFCKNENIDVVFRKATTIERLYNKEITNEFYTSNPENSFFADFLTSKSLMKQTKNPARRLFYRDLSRRLILGTSRKAPCHFQNNGVLISAHGNMSHCSIDTEILGDCTKDSAHSIYFKKESKDKLNKLIQEKCHSCLHDQSGSWNPLDLFLEQLNGKLQFIQKIPKFFNFGIKNLRLMAGIYSRKIIKNERVNPTAHIIGAYGGEHVGDSAILGGVILRLLNRSNRNIVNFTVYSKRPDRTNFWINGLNLPKDISVNCENYDKASDIEVSSDDIIVWGGGPIMEMPNDLLNHLLTIKAFKKVGIEFNIVGAGFGPFKSFYSRWLAFKILRLSSHVEMRDKYNLKNIEYVLKQDPAFDYLSSHMASKLEDEWNWNRLKSDKFIEKIKEKGYDKFVMLNLRPMWSKYNKSEMTIEEIHDTIYNSVMNVIENVPKNIAVVSVPFNTDHYGFSDMEPALYLKDICVEKGMENFFVYDRELNARDTIYFLKNFDAGICMRFHACIFMKGLGIPVYGLDYTAGELGKVGGLFRSFEDPNYSNILSINSEEIMGFINDSVYSN